MNPTTQNKTLIRVYGIPGSLRKGSFTRAAVQLALRGAEESGAQVRLLDLREYPLVFCDGKEDESAYPEGVFLLRSLVKEADGLILGTPEYHGGVSGVLKNALDLMGFEELEGKMIGLVGVSGGAFGAFDALNTLRNVGRALHAWVVPHQVSVPEAWRVFDETGAMKDPKLQNRLKEVGQQVHRFAYLHRCGEAPEFLKIWETAPPNPGAA